VNATATPVLPRRDWLIIPGIVVLTTLVLLIAAEVVARVGWPEDHLSPCTPLDGSVTANCASKVKAFEGAWHEERFNECGYRGTSSCKEHPAAGRIAVLGSSTSWGYLVPFEQAFSVQAAQIIGARCGVRPDIQSLAGFNSLNESARRLPEVLALHPQLALLVIAPFDLLEMPQGGFNVESRAPKRPKVVGLMARLQGLLGNSRAISLAQHVLYRNASFYVTTYLRYGDKAAYLRLPFTPEWTSRIAYVDGAVAYIADRLRTAQIPFMLVYSPQLAQADMVGAAMSFPGVDPFALGRTLGEIAARHGVAYVDGTYMFQGVRDAPDYFLRVNGHLNENGHSLLGRTVASGILASPPTGLCGGSALAASGAPQERR
jgi:hypothetical protein